MAAYQAFGRQLSGATDKRNYVYRSKRGAKPKSNPMLQYIIDNTQSSEATQQSQANEPTKKRKRGRPPLSDVIYQI